VKTYLGIDLGTQGVKALLMDGASGAVLARASCELPAPSTPRPGAAEQHPDDWWMAFVQVMDQLLATDGIERSSIRALGVSGQQHGMVALDGENQVLHPAKLWCDVEAVDEAAELSRMAGRAIPAGFTAPKVLWLKRRHPQIFARMQKLLLPHDWLNLRLTGRHATDHGDASGTGLYDPVARKYDHATAAAIDARLPEMLAPLLQAQQVHGTLLPELATRFGLPADLKISAGSGDNMMAALGAGATQADVLVISLGTSGTLFGHSDHAIVDPQGEVAPFCDATGGWLPLVCTQNCTTVPAEVRDAFKLSHSELTQRAFKVPAGCNGLVFLPYLTGERTPNWPAARGILHGMQTGSLQPGILYRAALEGASLALAHGYQRLQQLGLPTQRIRLVGGGARNPLWAQILASMLNVPIEISPETEAAALGAARQAAWMDAETSLSDLMRRWSGPKSDLSPPSEQEPMQGSGRTPSRVLPITEDVPVYAQTLQRFQQLGQRNFA
jgi:xylulokinase